MRPLAIAALTALLACAEPAPPAIVSIALSAAPTLSAAPSASASAPRPVPSARAESACADTTSLKSAVDTAILPRSAVGFCLDPDGKGVAFGEGDAYTLADACTRQLDGECETYVRLGVKRIVVAEYVDRNATANSVYVLVERFADAGGAYAMFTTRVVGEHDPLAASVMPLAVGTVAGAGRTNAYVWQGDYVVELLFSADDPSMSQEEIAVAGSAACAAIAKAIGERLPPASSTLADVQALPTTEQIPFGVSYAATDALGIPRLGAAAVGYYKGATKRYRLVSMVRESSDRARDAMKILKSRPGALPLTGAGDEAVAVVVDDAIDGTTLKAEYVFARKGGAIFGVGDEVRAIPKNATAESARRARLTRAEKLSRLSAWMKARSASTLLPR